MLRWLVATLSSLGGSSLVLGLLVWVNQRPADPPASDTRAVVDFAVQAPEPPPPAPRPAPRPRPQPTASHAPPSPMLGAGVGGLDLGLGALDAELVSADDLLGGAGDVVMTAQTVDEAPRPQAQTAPAYPARARARGIEGTVTLSLLIDESGRVSEASVLDAQPPGVFDDAALAAVRQWRFTPARYEGRSVRVRVEQPLRFDLR